MTVAPKSTYETFFVSSTAYPTSSGRTMPTKANPAATSSSRSSASSGDFERNIVPSTWPRSSSTRAAMPMMAKPHGRSTFQLPRHDTGLLRYDGKKMMAKQAAMVMSAAISLPNQMAGPESGLEK